MECGVEEVVCRWIGLREVVDAVLVVQTSSSGLGRDYVSVPCRHHRAFRIEPSCFSPHFEAILRNDFYINRTNFSILRSETPLYSFY